MCHFLPPFPLGVRRDADWRTRNGVLFSTLTTTLWWRTSPRTSGGWLLSALCVYAERVWRDPSVTMEEILDHYPQMSGQTRIACGFLGAAVLRDTQRWLSQRQARALRRQQGDRPGRPPAPARERSWSREQDMELTRKLAARLREEAAMAEAGGAEGQD